VFIAQLLVSAADAAAEATDAANAATDAANAAAEAADAATAAAQDAADAVAALQHQFQQWSCSKKQITALTNLVIKIQKKVKA
jgi:trimeric autotransporter adhesin